MRIGFHGKRLRRPVLAAMAIACMMLCTMGPLAPAWSDDDTYAATFDDGKFTYVSLGDSMVNGFGMTGYYDSNNVDNSYGFLVDTETTYPHMLTEYIESRLGAGNVEHIPLAVSAMRSTELRALLDETFTGDEYTSEILMGPTSPINDVFKALPAGYSKDLDGMRAFTSESLSKAELVTYQFHYDFGYSISRCLSGFLDGGTIPAVDFSTYMDDDAISYMDSIKSEVLDRLRGEMYSWNMDAATSEQAMVFMEGLADTFAYIVVGYCSNFDANVRMMLELNPDVRIVTVDSYNTFVGMQLKIGENRIPLGSIYDLVLDSVNMYTKYFSEYSDKTYHVSLDEVPTVFIDEFRDGGDIDNDSKNIFMAALQSSLVVESNGYIKYNLLDTFTVSMMTIFGTPVPVPLLTNHHNLSNFLNHVFSVNEFDWDYMTDPSMDMNARIADLSAKVMRVIADPGNLDITTGSGIGYMLKPGGTVTYDESTGSCTVSCNEGSETFDRNELSLLWMNFYFLQTNAGMTHPSSAGHTQIYNAVRERFIERDILGDGPVEERSLYTMLFEDCLPSYTASDAVPNTSTVMLNLGDNPSGTGAGGYPAMVADRFGLTLSPLSVSGDFRVDDLNHILGGTDRHDAYTDALLETLRTDMGMTTEEIMETYQDAVRDSNTILVKMGMGNMLFPILQTLATLEDGTLYEMDFTGFDCFTEEMYRDMMKVRGHLDSVIEGVFGENIEVMDAYEDSMNTLGSILYSSIGYIDNYYTMVGRIHELNPYANIICIGMYNGLDGFRYADAERSVDIGSISETLVGILNDYTGRMLSECRNTVFVDIRDVHVNDTDINVRDLQTSDDLLDCVPLAMLDSLENQEVADRIIDGIEGSAYYTVADTSPNGQLMERYRFGQTIPSIEDPVKPGYTFTGWLGSVPGTMPATNVTITSQWDLHEYSVVFDANGGVGTMPGMSFECYEEKRLVSNTFTKQDLSFDGWNTEADGSGTSYDDGQTVMNLSFDDGDVVTLYAQWRPIEYSVVFDANGGEGTMESQTMTCGTPVPLDANGFTKTGYVFAGWDTEADGSGASYDDGQTVINLSHTEGDEITMYAQWAPISYTVVFDANGGEGTMESQTMTYDVQVALNDLAFTRAYYVYMIWNTSADGTGMPYGDGQSVVNLVSVNNGSITLYAQWVPITYTVVFDANGGEGTMDGQILEGDLSEALDANRFTKTGYVFAGWDTEADGSGTDYPDGQSVVNLVSVNNGSITLYAQWAPISYTVVFDANGGEGTMESQTMTYDAQSILDANLFTKSDHSFRAWNTMADGSGVDYEDGGSVINLCTDDGGTVTLYAQWESTAQDWTMVIIGGVVAAIAIGLVAVFFVRRS